jgi:6-phosphogluconolactonase
MVRRFLPNPILGLEAINKIPKVPEGRLNLQVAQTDSSMGTPQPTALNREIHILPDAAAIAKRAAQEILQAATSAVAERGSFTLVLAGGSTPKALYQLLVNDAALRTQLPWDKMVLLFGDERHVPPDHPDSNFHMATESMISKAPLKPEQVLRIKGEYQDTEKAAQEYEQTLRERFKLRDSQFPRFDMILLGMGNDGHTLSLFPGTKALHQDRRLVVRNWIGKLYTERITMTAPVANNAAQVIFMVTGADKALALKAVLEGPYEPEQLPSQLIQPRNGKLQWLVDTPAGGMLSTGIRE